MRKYNVAQISFLIACGSALQLAEAFIPYPVPGVKVGLANISTLLGLVLFGIPAALEIAVFRPVITSLINGTFLSPGFILSLCGSFTSFLAMAAIEYATRHRKLFSLAGISIIGAITHNMTQLALVYHWLIPHHGLLAFTPFLVLSAVIGGYLVGWSTDYVLSRIPEEKGNVLTAYTEKVEVPEETQELTLLDKLKIILAFVMVLSTIFWKTFAAYTVLILLVFVLMLFSGKRIAGIGKRLFRLWGVVVFSFFLPVLFSPGGAILWHWKWVRITEAGLLQGALFALRLVFLISISIWIGIEDPRKLSQELAWILSPLRYFNLSVDRIPKITSLSLSFVPVIWEKLTHVKPKKLKPVLDVLVVFFVGLEQS